MTTTLGYFGDHRREASGTLLLHRLLEVGQRGVKVRRLGGTRGNEKRLRRFLHSTSVTPEEMVETARARTAGLVAGRHILAIQDTTSLRDDGKDHGHYLHATIAVDADSGALLGLVDAEFLLRQGKQPVHCNKRPFAEKESARWLRSTCQSAGLAVAGAHCVTSVADREGDIYDEFALRPANTELLIRCTHDRQLLEGGTLFSSTQDLADLGEETIAVPAAPGRAARNATLRLFAHEVTLRRPKRNRASEAAKLPAALTLTYLEAREIDAPAHVKQPLHWRLLSTHRVGSLTEAQWLIGLYRRRWTIEQLFRVLKTQGFDIEAVEMQMAGAFENLVAATLIAAVRVLQMVQDRDGADHRPLGDAFEPDDQPALQAICRTLEGRTAKQQNPHPPDALAYAAWICARLGGWTGYYGKPGPIVMFNGLVRLNAMLEGYRIARQR